METYLLSNENPLRIPPIVKPMNSMLGLWPDSLSVLLAHEDSYAKPSTSGL